MTATTIVHEAGTAKPLLTMPGWFTVDIHGDWMPTVVEGKQRVLDLLDTTAAARTTRTLPSGEVPTPGLATPARVREAVTAPTVPAGDSFHSP